MTVLVRPINGNLGSAIGIRDGFADEKKLAVFADAGIQDCAYVGSNYCVLLSRKFGIALVDIISCEVIKRSRLRRPADRIAVSGDGTRAIAYHCNPGLLTILDLTTLEETAYYNLIQTCPDGAFQLLYRDRDALRKDGAPWDSIPFSDGPLRGEVKAGELWLKYAPAEPNGLRRLRFTCGARAKFRADGKVVAPFEFSDNGLQWVWSRHGEKPITASARDFRVGVAVIDLNAARLEMHVLRRQIEPSVYTTFPVQSISPDGLHAILPSFDPIAVVAETQAQALGGRLRELFGRRPDNLLAFGLEVWDITGKPELTGAIAFRPLKGETLLRINTLRFNEAELAEARKEIELVFPGVEAGFAGREGEWRTSGRKRQEDAYFDPLETRKAPIFNPAFNRVHFPPLFIETVQRLMKLRSKPFSTLPWEDMSDRQRRFVAGVLGGWSRHSAQALDSTVWIADDRFVVLSRDGTVREFSLVDGIGPAYRLVDPHTHAWPYCERDIFPPELIHLRGRAFAVDLYNVRLEFDLPLVDKFGLGNLDLSTPLTYRVLKDAEGHKTEVEQVDRLAEAIRRGYVKIGSKQPTSVVAGLRELAREVRDHLNEVVVDHRWLPSLHYRGKPVVEAEFCDILVADGSDEAAYALDGLLTAFLDATGAKRQYIDIWHPDDRTPTMGPVTLALLKMCDSLPSSVALFYAQRDMHHDMWTSEAFERLDLSHQRLLSPDLVTLQIRLAIQDICTGNFKADIFALYRLPLVREALHANPALGHELAEVIIGQLEAQTFNLARASGAGVAGVLEAIAEGLNAEAPAEAALAEDLRRQAKVRQDQ